MNNDTALSIGMPVYISGSVGKGKADNITTATVVGLCADTSIANGATGDIQTSGPMTASTAQWAAITDDGLTISAGSNYFVSTATAGKITSTPTTTAGKFSTKIGHAISSTILIIEICEPVGV